MDAGSLPIRNKESEFTDYNKENHRLLGARQTAEKSESVVHKVISGDVVTKPATFSGKMPRESNFALEYSMLPSMESYDKLLKQASIEAEKNLDATGSSKTKAKEDLKEVNEIHSWELAAYGKRPTREPPIISGQTKLPEKAVRKEPLPKTAKPEKPILKKPGQKSAASPTKQVRFSDTTTLRKIDQSGIQDRLVDLNPVATVVKECIDTHVSKWRRTEEDLLIDYKDIKRDVQLELLSKIENKEFRDDKAKKSYLDTMNLAIKTQIRKRQKALGKTIDEATKKLVSQHIAEWEKDNPGKRLSHATREVIKQATTEEFVLYLLEHPEEFR